MYVDNEAVFEDLVYINYSHFSLYLIFVCACDVK